MILRYVCRFALVLVIVVLHPPLWAEELGFPKPCVELQRVSASDQGSLFFDALCSQNSAFCRLGSFAKDPCTFTVWDIESGRWLAKRSAPHPHGSCVAFFSRRKFVGRPAHG